MDATDGVSKFQVVIEVQPTSEKQEWALVDEADISSLAINWPCMQTTQLGETVAQSSAVNAGVFKLSDTLTTALTKDEVLTVVFKELGPSANGTVQVLNAASAGDNQVYFCNDAIFISSIIMIKCTTWGFNNTNTSTTDFFGYDSVFTVC